MESIVIMESTADMYAPAILSLGVIAGLMLIQMLVVDVIGIRAKHVPGAPVPADHDNLLFRATRAHANTNESIAVFILLLLFCMISSASPAWVNGLAWTYLAGRAGHMLCYYANLKLARSMAFGVSLVALIGLLVVGIAA